MLKRLNMVIAVLMTVSMLIVPLAAAGQSPVTSSDEAQADTQPVSAAAQDTPPPAPQLVHAPPTGQDPLPPMEESIELPFELISVIRSCEDQTRFDLEWEGTGEIASVKYVLFNSSDNSSTEGEIDGTYGFASPATIWGKPGDTAMSVDVLLVGGEEFRYLADASLCGVSEVSETGKPAVITANTDAATASEETGVIIVRVHVKHAEELTEGFHLCVTRPDLPIANPLKYVACSQQAAGISDVEVRFDRIPAGGFEIVLSRIGGYGFHPEATTFVVLDAGKTLEVDMTWERRPTAHVTFRFNYPEGHPNSPLSIRIETLNWAELPWYTSLSIPSSGILTVEVPAGSLEYSVSPVSGYTLWDPSTGLKWGWSGLRLNHLEEDEERTIEWLVGTNTYGELVNIALVPSGGESLMGAKVCLESTNSRNYLDRRCVSVDYENNAFFGYMNSGNYHLKIETIGNYPAFDSREGFGNVIVDSEYGPTNITLPMERKDAGSVVVQAGEWRAGATVVLQWDYSNEIPYQEVVQLDANGEFTFEYVWVGSYSLTVRGTESSPGQSLIRSYSEQLDVTSDGEVHIVIPHYAGYVWRTDPRYYNEPGAKVKIEGSSFGVDQEISFHWGTVDGPEIGPRALSSDDGRFEAEITLPPNIPDGEYVVHAVGNYGVSADLEIWVHNRVPTVYLWPYEGAPGDLISIEGGDFSPAAPVSLRWGSEDGAELGTATAGADGYFSSRIKVPSDATNGRVTIFAIAENETASIAFTVTGAASQEMFLSPASGQAGTGTTVSGSGFASGETVTFTWDHLDGPPLGTTTADQDGTFEATVVIPNTSQIGTFTIYAAGENGLIATADFNVNSVAETGSVVVRGNFPWPNVSGQLRDKNGWLTYRSVQNANGALVFESVPYGTYELFFIVSREEAHKFPDDVVIGPGSSQVEIEVEFAAATLTPATGRAGTVTSVSGSGYQPGETVTIRWGGASGTVLGAVKATASGTFSGKVTVPAIATVGTYSIHATGGSSNQTGSASYQVTALAVVKVNLSITTGRAGSITAVMGNGFQPGETVTIRWGSANGQSLGSVKVSPSGTISGKVTVPPIASVGTFSIHASGGTSKQTGSVTYRVSALAVVKVNLSITTGRAGSITAVMGSGFQPGETVTIRWGNANGPVLGAVKASPTGTISGKVTIPRVAQLGTFNIHVSGSTSKQVGTAKYTVNRLVMATIKLSPASGRAGTIISVTGTGYRPGEIVTIRWGGASGPVMGSVKATSAGTFSGKVVVPKNAAKRTYAVHVSGGTSKQVGVTPFIVTQLAASAPGRQDVAREGIAIRL